MRIGDVDLDERVLVVAEIGNNHEGDLDVARDLVRQAAEAGVGAVKFQTYRTEHYVSRADAERFARLESFRLPDSAWAELSALAHGSALLFLSTPLDLGSLDLLLPVVDGVKIASGDNDFVPLLRRAARSDRPLVVSTGVSDLDRVLETVDLIERERAAGGSSAGLVVLHCVSSYPTPPEEANLLAIGELRERLSCTIGYSDHTTGLDAAMLAVALGARVIEKHFTLDKGYSAFRDHQLSADPAELAELVRAVRRAETLLGRPGKRLQASEAGNVAAIRRSIVAGRDLPAGHELVVDDFTWIRPAGGLRPGEEWRLVGRRLGRPVRFGERIAEGDLA